MKKILFISPLPPPNYGSAMSSKMCLDILKKSQRFEVRNIKINLAENMKNVGKISFDKIKKILRKIDEIREIIQEFDPDIVYFMPATSGLGLYKDYLMIREIRKLGKKIVYHLRTHISNEEKKEFIKRKLYKKIFENSKIIVLDEFLKNDVRNFVRKKDIFILPNAIKNEIPEKEFRKNIKKRMTKKIFQILFLSNMHESKGWPILLRACALLRRDKINFKCIFIGNWPTEKEKAMFFEFIKKEELGNNVKYLGEKIGKEKYKELGDADVLVFPTHYSLEAHPRIILEGMMAGLPIIANEYASIPNTVKNDETGFLLKKNSPEEIVDNIKILLKNKRKRIRMGIAGRKRFLRKYEIKNYKVKFLNMINDMI